MIELGKYQSLQMITPSDFGVYLAEPDSSGEERVLLPKNQVPETLQVGDSIEVFIYRDSEDRIIATTITPLLTLGALAKLKVLEVGTIGAFLDWGLAKDLLLPFKEQTKRVHQGDQVLVSLYIDKSNRLCATMKVYDYLEQNSPYKKDDRIIGTVYEINEKFGAYVAVDDKYSGLIATNELYRDLEPGDSIEARVQNVKEDGKLDLSTREKAYLQMNDDATLVLKKLEEHDGELSVNDKTPPEIIKKEFNLSKNAFKRALGRLLKEDKIEFTEGGIRLKNNETT